MVKCLLWCVLHVVNVDFYNELKPSNIIGVFDQEQHLAKLLSSFDVETRQQNAAAVSNILLMWESFKTV